MNFRKLDITQTKLLRRWGWFLLGLGWAYGFPNVLSCMELVRNFFSGQISGRASGTLSLVFAVIVMAELVLASRVLWEAESGRPFCLHGQTRITQITNPWYDSDSIADQTWGALGGGLAGIASGVLQMLGMSATHYMITIGMQPGFLPRMIEAVRIRQALTGRLLVGWVFCLENVVVPLLLTAIWALWQAMIFCLIGYFWPVQNLSD